MKKNIYDVAICGAGLAGLTLARQLKQTLPNLSIILLDRLARPLPEATHKVGESTLSVGTYYLANVLGLQDYLDKCHLPKLGLRYFFGNTQGAFAERPELGQSEFFQRSHPYQLDRGRLENDLRQFNIDMGIELLEHCSVKDIELSKTLEIPHQITYTQADKKNKTIQALWVIDALGRRRLLQNKLGLAKPNNPRYNAVWFRLKGLVDVSDFVPVSNHQWHDRVPYNNRYYSTNHLCGDGYWVWLIPLSSGYTSIGIVADEEIHPFGSYHTYDLAYQWLEKHEPVLALHLRGKQPADFKKMPRYSYSSQQVFSSNRWACIGEAGIFTDPFHSSGTDLIALSNCLTTQMIELDLKAQLTGEAVEEMNHFFLTYRDRMTHRIQSYYSCFTNEVVVALKYIWDIMTAWAFNSPLMYGSLLLDNHKRALLNQFYEHFAPLEERVQQLFLDWSKQSLQRVTYDYVDYTQIAFMNQHRGRNFAPQNTEQELIERQFANLELFEEFAQAIFLIAITDTMPEELPKVTATGWLNAWAISLNPSQWSTEGLFSPSSKPRNIHHVTEPLNQILQIKEPIFKPFTYEQENSFVKVNTSFAQTCSQVPAGLRS